MQDDFGTPDRTWRTFSNHGGASAPSRIFLVGTIASKVLAKGNTWSTGSSHTTPSGDRIGRGTPGRIASRGFPARVSPPAWKATWPAQNKPTRPSIFSLIHNSYPRRISYPDMAIINDPCACTYDISDETFGIHIRMFPFKHAPCTCLH